MQPIIVAHILSRYLDAYFEKLASAFPFQPLNAIHNNYLRMSETGHTPRIEEFSRVLYEKIKELELEEDPPYVIEHPDGTVDKYREDELPNEMLPKESRAFVTAPSDSLGKGPVAVLDFSGVDLSAPKLEPPPGFSAVGVVEGGKEKT